MYTAQNGKRKKHSSLFRVFFPDFINFVGFSTSQANLLKNDNKSEIENIEEENENKT